VPRLLKNTIKLYMIKSSNMFVLSIDEIVLRNGAILVICYCVKSLVYYVDDLLVFVIC
jgi:hypothetical protein